MGLMQYIMSLTLVTLLGVFIIERISIDNDLTLPSFSPKSCARGQTCEFEIIIPSSEKGILRINMLGNGKPELSLKQKTDGYFDGQTIHRGMASDFNNFYIYTVTYKTEECGMYTLDITMNGKQFYQSPYDIHVHGCGTTIPAPEYEDKMSTEITLNDSEDKMSAAYILKRIKEVVEKRKLENERKLRETKKLEDEQEPQEVKINMQNLNVEHQIGSYVLYEVEKPKKRANINNAPVVLKTNDEINASVQPMLLKANDEIQATVEPKVLETRDEIKASVEPKLLTTNGEIKASAEPKLDKIITEFNDEANYKPKETMSSGSEYIQKETNNESKNGMVYIIREVDFDNDASLERKLLKINNEVEVPVGMLMKGVTLIGKLKYNGKDGDCTLTFNSDSKGESAGPIEKSITTKQIFSIKASNGNNNSTFTLGLYGPRGTANTTSAKYIGNSVYIIQYVIREIGEYYFKYVWESDDLPTPPFSIRVKRQASNEALF